MRPWDLCRVMMPLRKGPSGSQASVSVLIYSGHTDLKLEISGSSKRALDYGLTKVGVLLDG